MGDILLWIMLILVALATGFTALTSSGTGRLWSVDTLELRRQQRFTHVLSLHVHAVSLSRSAAAALVQPGEQPVRVFTHLSAEPLQLIQEPRQSTGTPERHDWAAEWQSTPAPRTAAALTAPASHSLPG